MTLNKHEHEMYKWEFYVQDHAQLISLIGISHTQDTAAAVKPQNQMTAWNIGTTSF